MKELKIEALTTNLDTVLDFINETLEEMDASMKTQMQLDIAAEEIFVNIAHYAYSSGTGMATIRVETQKEPKAVSISFEDGGEPFDPLAKADPDLTLSSEERQIGGLGIYMVKKSMDDVTYEYSDGKNILTITKNI